MDIKTSYLLNPENLDLELELSLAHNILNINQKSTNSAFWIWDENSQSIKLSEGIFDIFGKVDKSLAGIDSLMNSVTVADKFKVTKALYLVAVNYTDLYFECSIVCGSQIKKIKFSGEPIFDKAGKLAYYIGTVQDITEYDLKNQKIEDQNNILNIISFLSEKFLNTNINNLVETIEYAFEKASKVFNYHNGIIVNFDNDAEDKVLVKWKHPNYQKYHEIPINNSFIKDMMAYIHSFSDTPLEEYVAIFDSLDIIPEDFIQIRNFYRVQNIKTLIVIPLLTPDEFIGFTILINYKDNNAFDKITHSKLHTMNRMVASALVRAKYEELLVKAKEEAENANLSKSAFLANINHEIRTPLNSIIGYSNILKDSNKELKYNFYFDGILKSSKQLMELLTNIIDISKIQSGKVQINMKSINLQGIINELSSIYKDKALQKGVNFKLEMDSTLPGFIISDEPKIWQILHNLLENSVKFTEKGSIIFRIYKETQSDNSLSIKFEIDDTGTGIEHENIESIFNPFKQADDKLNRKFGGSGLGLSISKSLAELINGGLSVESEIGKGSKFTFYINKVEIQESDEKLEKEVYNSDLKKIDDNELVKTLGGKTFLIADDDKPNILILTKILEPYNINIKTAANGEDALEEFKNNNIDLVILDYSMPKLNGVQVARKIRDELANKPVNIVILTGYTSFQKIDGLDNIEFPMISKPIEFDAFKYKLYNLLKSSDTKTINIIETSNSSLINLKALKEVLENEFEIAFSTLNIDDIKKFLNKGLNFANNYQVDDEYLHRLYEIKKAIEIFNVGSIFNLMKEFEKKYNL